MELSSIQHIDPNQLVDFEADIFITTLGFESRCTTIARLLETKSYRKIALAKVDHSEEYAYTENSNYYTGQGYELISVESKAPDIGSFLGNRTRDHLKVLIDCTSMTPRWYYEFFKWFDENQDDYSEAVIRLAYTMASFEDQGTVRKVKSVKNFLNTEHVGGKNKKTALILGLGHEQNVCDSIYKKVNPDLLFLFYADPPVDKQFVEKVFVNNHALINSIPIRNLIAYPIRNGQITYQILIDTILPLRNEYTVVLVPQGPKSFSVVAMLVHLGYPDIHISYPKFKKPPVVDRHPYDKAVVLDIHFERED